MLPLAWVAIAGLNAALAVNKAQQQAKQRENEAKMRAAEIEASPWTGHGPTTQVSTAPSSIWGELAGAGVNTLGQGAALQGAGLFNGAEEAGQLASEGGSTIMPTSREALSQNSSFLNPWQDKQNIWLSAFNKR